MALLKRTLSCQHLIKHCSKRPNICFMVDFFTSCLFRRHVGGCSHNCRRFCQVSSPGEFGQSKVSDLRLAFLCEHDVGRFDVSMNDSFFMGFLETFRNLHGDVNRFFYIQSSGFYPVF